MRNTKISFKLWLAALLGVAVMMTPAAGLAVNIDLCVGETTVTMPDGVDIVVWGFADGGATDGTNTVCTNTPSVPGPVQRVSDSGEITITVTNTLSVPVSVMMPGQAPLGADVTPVWIDPTSTTPMTDAGTTSATRPADVTLRARSFVKEAPANSSGTVYTWSNPRYGTFLYQSATQPQVQVQMGLYGALINEPSANARAYAGIGQDGRDVDYTDDQVLVFSEFDVAIHDAVATGNYGPTGTMTSTIDYEPSYYLINGQPYALDQAPMALTAVASETVLLRFLNAGYDTVVPAVQGAGILALQAEDGFGYPYARNEYSVDLPAGKTVDATFTAPADRYIAVYDRRLNLSSKGGGPTSGGQLAYLTVGTENATLNVIKDAAGTGQGSVTVASMPGGVVCAAGTASCSATFLDQTAVRLVAEAAPGSGFKGWSGACTGYDECVVTLDQAAATDVTATFKAFNKVKLLTMNDGGSFMANTMQPLYVAAPANADTYKYSLSTDNGSTWERITRKISDSGMNWLIPPLSKAAKNKALVQVEVYDVSNTLIGSDVTDMPFSIRLVEVLTPVALDTLTGGGSTVITWASNTSAVVGSVTLQYRKKSNKPWTDIATVQGNPGAYTWNLIPDVNATKNDASIRVILYDRQGVKIDADTPDGSLTWNPAPPA